MENQTPKEQYEARRAEEKKHKHQDTVASRSGRGRGKLIGWGIAIAVILGLGYALWSAVSAEIPKGPDRSIAYAIVSRDHISENSPRPTNYNSNPPTSGPHFATPAAVGFYPGGLPDMRVVHNLEHGDVWISYKGSVSSSTVEALKGLLDGVKVIVTRRDDNDTDVAAASWGRLDKFNLAGGTISADELQRLKDFILRYKNRAPESALDSAAMLGTTSPQE